MDCGSIVDHTVDFFVSPDDTVDLDLPDTPRPAKVPRFKPKIKGKAKVTGFYHAPKLEAVAIAGGSNPSTENSGALLRSDGTEKAVTDTMEVDDGDDIVREISVFCGSGNLGEDVQLYVMQHVLREAWRPYELNKRCEEVRLNPKQLKIEVDLRMEGDDANCEEEKSKPLKLQKQTLSSSVVSSGIQYAIGVLEKNKFHLNPVHALLQLRPSFQCLHDDLLKKEFVSKTSEASTKVIKPWVLLQYYSMDSSISNKTNHKMAAEVVDHVQFMMKPSDYIHFLPSGNLADEMVNSVPSMRILHHMPLEERLKKWFCEVIHILISLGMMFICIDVCKRGSFFVPFNRNQISSFDALKHLAYGYSEDDLLKVLPSYAFLVQGLWVCKSYLLYSGAEAVQRDYILLLFTRMNTIPYHKLREINLSPSVFKCMMSALAYDRKSLRDWKFKQSTDLSFIKRYPNIVREQENAWLGHEKLILDSLRKVGKKFPIMKRASLASNNVKFTTARKADSPFTNRDRDVIGSLAGQAMSSETREHLPKALIEIFNDKKVRSLQSVVRGLREMALYKSFRPKEDPKTRLLVNAAANAVSSPVKELRSVIDQVAVHIHGVYVLKSAGNPELDRLRNVVINLFQSKEPNAKLRKQEIKQAAQISLKKDISDSEYNKVIHELCISSSGAWELKNGE